MLTALGYQQDLHHCFHRVSCPRFIKPRLTSEKSPSVPQRVNSVLHKKRRRNQKEQLPRLALFGPWLPICAEKAVSLLLTPITASHLAIISCMIFQFNLQFFMPD